MNGRRVWLRICLVCLGAPAMLLAAARDGGNRFVGYGGPGGSRVYADSRPPLKFDHTTGEGIRWEAPLPSWGHGSPIAVAQRVFVMCETGPENIFPMLVCLDAADGQILWKRQMDHLPAITPDKAKQETLRRRLRAYFDRPSKEEQKALYRDMGLVRDEYHVRSRNYGCIGEAYGTPVSDGEFVYGATAWGAHACFDMDGKQRWLSYCPGSKNEWNNRAPSPILHGDLLIHSNVSTLRAFDRRTGRLLWKHDVGFTSIATPAVITVGGKDVLLTPSNCGDFNAAYLLPDGKPLAIQGWRDCGMQILVKHDEPDVVFFCGSGEHCTWTDKGVKGPPNPPAAVRFFLEGSTLKAKVLWHGGQLGDNKNRLGGNAPWMVYHDGKFYHRGGTILDALTGKTVAGAYDGRSRDTRATPKTQHILAVAGGHVYGLHRGMDWPTTQRYQSLRDKPVATMQVFTLDGKWVADNVLVRREPTEEQKKMHRYCTGGERPWMDGRDGCFSYGWTFTFDSDSIYIRSMESLICAGLPRAKRTH
jgi:hypothetical protein